MRIGIALRLVGLLVLAGVLAINFTALKNRTFEGRTAHYTVIVDTGVDAKSVASEHADRHGFVIEKVVDSEHAYVASMPAGHADSVLDDSRVSHVVTDAPILIERSLWDSALVALHLKAG